MKELTNKIVWITGASSGIGEALAYEMAQAGATLILSSRNETELQRVRAGCAFPEKHSLIPLDLEKYQEFEEKVSLVWEKHGPIDVLINNAGISQRYLVVDSRLELDEKIMNINFFGPIALTRPILKKMLERGSGHIAVVSSMLGLYGIQTRSAYSASKHALRGYFECLRNELFNTKIKITIIFPGYINTQITANALMADGTTFGRVDEFHSSGIPSKECAQKIVHAIRVEKPVLIVAGVKERFGLFIARFLPAVFRYIAPKFEI